jgi:outer membrane protein assembly factor BamB
MVRPLLLLLAALAATRSSASGESWPEFRGPTGQGLVPAGRLPIEWSPTKNVVWKQAIAGKGWSSPVLAEGRLYLTSSIPVSGNAGTDQSLRALCLDAASGKILWQREVFRQNGAKAPAIHVKNSHASPTPLLHGRHLYLHFGHQGTACLDLAGNVRWRNTSLAYAPVHGNGGSPIVVDDTLIFSCDGAENPFVVGLACGSGEVVWKTERRTNASRTFSFSTPLLIEVNGHKQVISPGSNLVAAYDPRTGQEIWRVRYEGYSLIPRPVFGHGLVFVSTGYNTPSLLAIRPDGKGDATDTHVAWMLRRGAPHTPSPLLVGEELYLVSDNGTATCLDARTGKVHWQERLRGAFSASPLGGDGKIYFQSEQGVGFVIRASRQFEQLARNDLNERTLASYAVLEGALFIRTEKHLYRIQAP